MAADVVRAYKFVEACFMQSGLHLRTHPREHYLYALTLARLTEVGEVVYTRRVNERHLTHTDDAHLRTVAIVAMMSSKRLPAPKK